MKLLAGFWISIAAALILAPGVVQAQQTGDSVQGSQLQSSGSALQQAPASLQGSAPQIFGSGGGLLDQANQKLTSDLEFSSSAGKQKIADAADKNISLGGAQGLSKIAKATLCLGLAALAFLIWLWLRRIEYSSL